ncbi:serine hydrolase domain-containing protein [Emticicia sp. 17c]|uniref:serine hydrolase domain-containing protein n=1 Tax=Emticicia sp. 17c TaxID=3127704 RepID=UPI00301D76B7
MKYPFLLLLLLNLSQHSFTQAQVSDNLTPLQIKKLDSIATQDVPALAPGIATAIISNGTVIYQKTVGFADLADSSFITETTKFNIASNGKQFTALAILILEEEGKLKLSDDIRKYLPTLYPNLKTAITIEHLLTHRSGIRDIYDLWSLQGLTWWKNTFNNDDVVSVIQQQHDLNFEPGTAYLYSNTNYILLAKIIEQLTKNSFVAYTNEMFRKLDMPNTSFIDDYTQIKGHIARAYFNFNTWTNYQWKWNVCGDGNVFSTLQDQIQWEMIIQGKVPLKIKQRIIKKSQLLSENFPKSQYGYGLEFGSYKGKSYRFHEGATGAWKATVIRFSKPEITFITLTNTGKAIPSMQTRQMADVVFNFAPDSEYFLTKPEKTSNYLTDNEILGIYQTDNNFIFRFEKINDQIYLKRFGRNDVKLSREAPNIWHQTYDPDFKQEFKRNEKGQLQVTAYYTTHEPYTLTKTESNWVGFDSHTIVGKYRNDETAATLEIRPKQEKTYEVIIKESAEGLLISPDKMIVNGYVLEITNNSIKLNGDRIKRVLFRKTE